MEVRHGIKGATGGRRQFDAGIGLAVVVCLAIITLLFQAPFAEVNSGTGVTLIRWWDLAYLAIIAFGLLFALRHRSATWTAVPRLSIDLKDPLWWALALAAIAALSLVWAWTGFGSSGFVAEAMRVVRLSVAILLAGLIRRVFNESRMRYVAPTAIIVVATITAVWAFAALLFLTDDRPVPFQQGFVTHGVTRAGGPFGNQFSNGFSDHSWVSAAASNNAGFLLAVALAIALVWGVRSWKGWSQSDALKSFAWLLTAAVLVAGLVATHSRESMLAALAATIMVGGATSRRAGWRPFAAALALGAVAVLLLAFAVPSFGDRIVETFRPGSYDYITGPQARFDAWWEGLQWGAERFPIGYGIGAIEEHPERFGGGATSENLFIQTWAQTGLVGLVAMIALVATAIRNSAIALRREAALPTALSLSFFTALLVHGQFGNTLWDPTLLLVFGVALAFAGPVVEKRDPPQPDDGETP